MHILFIHPDQKLASIYHRHLGQHFSLDSAQDGLTGLRKIKLHRPRLIISDYDLPYMSGLSLLQYVRQHPEMCATPFIFLTNAAMPDDALGLGATAWLRQGEHGPDSLMAHLYSHRRILHA
jgi:two-component system, chemotaxis family, sensor kinase CheA